MHPSLRAHRQDFHPLKGSRGSICRGISLGRSGQSYGGAAGVRFDSPEEVTSGKSTWEVLRGWLVFKMLAFDYLVNNSLKV